MTQLDHILLASILNESRHLLIEGGYGLKPELRWLDKIRSRLDGQWNGPDKSPYYSAEGMS